ncbi:MAG: paraslipin [Rickettsiales bacterium]|nr:paraslipin [Rickettsiales bacterium]
MEYIIIALGVVFLIAMFMSIKIVPEQEAWIVQRMGKFHKKLLSGLNIILPVVDSVAYKHVLKEEVIDIHAQGAITKDNVSMKIDGILYVKILDPIAASYGVIDPHYAIAQLAQTTMRSEIGKIQLDKTFEERETLNTNIVNAINEAAASWGIQCMRYEIKDIIPPDTVKQAMELQVAAERQKRAQILESEGDKQSQINKAEAHKQEVVLKSEAAYQDQVNRAKGKAEAILQVAQASAESIERIAKSMIIRGADEAVSLKIAERYVEAFSNLAKEGNTVIVPSDVNDISGVIGKSLGIFNSIQHKKVKGKKV